MSINMTLEQIKSHNDVRNALLHNRDYRASWKCNLKQAIFEATVSRNPEGDRAVADGIAEEAAERFLTNFTK